MNLEQLKRFVLPVMALMGGAALSLASHPATVRTQVLTLPPARLEIANKYVCDNDPENMFCLEQRYQELALAKGVKAAVVGVEAAYVLDRQVRDNCHEIMHAIGRTAADNAKDIDDAYAKGNNFCSSGYYHGVMESIMLRLGPANLETAIPLVCTSVRNKAPYSLSHHNCLHGLGHGIMDVKQGDIFASLRLCDLAGNTWEQEWCYSGVYMQNQMNEMDTDHDTAYLKADDPMYPCGIVGEVYRYQCYLMQAGHALRLAHDDADLVFRECANLESQYQLPCYQSMGYAMVGTNSDDTAGATSDCATGPTQEARENCVAGAVRNLVTFYHDMGHATGFCDTLDAFLQLICLNDVSEDFSTLNTDPLRVFGIQTGLLW